MLQDYLDQIVTDWFDLLEYCQSKDFDQKQFKIRMDFLGKQCARLKWDDQGYVCEQISQRLRA